MFSISLANFRSFKSQTFKFDKFNILIGENSSGKSSLFKFLLAIKQTLQAPSNREINFLFSGEYVDLGSYKESIYYHDDKLPLGFKFGFEEAYYEYFIDFMVGRPETTKSKEVKKLEKYIDGPLTSTITEIGFELSKELNFHQSIKTHIKNSTLGELIIELIEDSSKVNKGVLYDTRCNLRYLDFSTMLVYELKNIRYTKDAFMSIIDGEDLRSSTRKTFGVPDTDFIGMKISKEQKDLVWKADRLFNRVAFLIVTQNFLRSTIERLEYINPINTQPSRFYLNKDQKRLTTINDLEDVIAFFSKIDSVKIGIFNDFVAILKKLGVADSIEILDDERLPVRELRVKVKDLMSNISDVGYGVSLQLPIILKALLADRLSGGVKRYILIEQPEVHLHPKLHAELINALISLSKNTTYFIETHSEHIVRKLQVLVKNRSKGLKPHNVTIHYLIRKDKQSAVTAHSITESGFLEPGFPSGFFDNSFNLSKQLL